MNTKELLTTIKQKFKVTTYWLEHFLDVSHANMSRYINGINEASFSNAQRWLKLLSIVVIGDNIYLKTGHHISVETINELNSDIISAHLNIIMDSRQWHLEDQKIEKKEGHRVWYLSKDESNKFKFRRT